MSNMVPCHNAQTCPSGGTATTHIAGSQTEVMCRKLSGRKRTRKEVPDRPVTDGTMGGMHMRSPACADARFGEESSWTEVDGDRGRVRSYCYLEDARLLGVALRDDPEEQDSGTTVVVYRDVDPTAASEIARANSGADAGPRVDDAFLMEVEDEYEVYAIGTGHGRSTDREAS